MQSGSILRTPAPIEGRFGQRTDRLGLLTRSRSRIIRQQSTRSSLPQFRYAAALNVHHEKPSAILFYTHMHTCKSYVLINKKTHRVGSFQKDVIIPVLFYVPHNIHFGDNLYQSEQLHYINQTTTKLKSGDDCLNCVSGPQHVAIGTMYWLVISL